MLAKGSGEFSGTSIMRIPAAYSTSPIPTTRSGTTPRRIATNAAPCADEPDVICPNPLRQSTVDLCQSRERRRGPIDLSCVKVQGGTCARVALCQLGRANQDDRARYETVRECAQCPVDVACNQQAGQVGGGPVAGRSPLRRPAAALEQAMQDCSSGCAATLANALLNASASTAASPPAVAGPGRCDRVVRQTIRRSGR